MTFCSWYFLKQKFTISKNTCIKNVRNWWNCVYFSTQTHRGDQISSIALHTPTWWCYNWSFQQTTSRYHGYRLPAVADEANEVSRYGRNILLRSKKTQFVFIFARRRKLRARRRDDEEKRSNAKTFMIVIFRYSSWLTLYFYFYYVVIKLGSCQMEWVINNQVRFFR